MESKETTEKRKEKSYDNLGTTYQEWMNILYV